MLINVKIDSNDLLNLLMDRLLTWWLKNDGECVEAKLFEKMYENYCENGYFEDAELNVMNIVDNDYVNWCSTNEAMGIESSEIIEELKKEYGDDVDLNNVYGSEINIKNDFYNGSCIVEASVYEDGEWVFLLRQ